MNLPWIGSDVGPSVQCQHCRVHFRPRLTRWACPVCDVDVPGGPAAGNQLAWHDPGTRVVAIVITATVVNLLLLAILTIIATH
jgi:hypothetical protein